MSWTGVPGAGAGPGTGAGGFTGGAPFAVPGVPQINVGVGSPQGAKAAKYGTFTHILFYLFMHVHVTIITKSASFCLVLFLKV